MTTKLPHIYGPMRATWWIRRAETGFTCSFATPRSAIDEIVRLAGQICASRVEVCPACDGRGITYRRTRTGVRESGCMGCLGYNETSVTDAFVAYVQHGRSVLWTEVTTEDLLATAVRGRDPDHRGHARSELDRRGVDWSRCL